MDSSSASAYVYAKACGMLAKSFIGARKDKLFEVSALADLWTLLFNCEVPLVPEALLAKQIEEKAEKTFVSDFIGLLNFVEIFSDHYFWNSVLFTFKYTIAMVIVSNIVALALAVAVESRRRTKALFRTVLYMPNMISLVIGGYMWMFILTKVFYYMADSWGWRFLEHSWIGNPQFSFFCLEFKADKKL